MKDNGYQHDQRRNPFTMQLQRLLTRPAKECWTTAAPEIAERENATADVVNFITPFVKIKMKRRLDFV